MIELKEMNDWNSHIEVRQNGVTLPFDDFGNTEFKNVIEAEMFILKSINSYRKNINSIKAKIKSLKEKNKDTNQLEYNLVEQQKSFGQFKPEIYQVLNGEDIRLTTYFPKTSDVGEHNLENLENYYD